MNPLTAPEWSSLVNCDIPEMSPEGVSYYPKDEAPLRPEDDMELEKPRDFPLARWDKVRIPREDYDVSVSLYQWLRGEMARMYHEEMERQMDGLDPSQYVIVEKPMVFSGPKWSEANPNLFRYEVTQRVGIRSKQEVLDYWGIDFDLDGDTIIRGYN